MKLIKLTASSLLFFSLVFGISSCERDAEQKITTDFAKSGIAITGAQEIPVSTSAALGTLDVFYTRETRILSYTVNWSGLSGPVTAMHIHGKGPVGYYATPAAPYQVVIGSGGIFAAGSAYGATGKVSGTLLVDGVSIKEEDLLSGQYYLHIHTATAGYSTDPRGEIRAQIVFQ